MLCRNVDALAVIDRSRSMIRTYCDYLDERRRESLTEGDGESLEHRSKPVLRMSFAEPLSSLDRISVISLLPEMS